MVLWYKHDKTGKFPNCLLDSKERSSFCKHCAYKCMCKGTWEKKELYKEIKADRVYTRVTKLFVINESGIRMKGSYSLVIEEGNNQ